MSETCYHPDHVPQTMRDEATKAVTEGTMSPAQAMRRYLAHIHETDDSASIGQWTTDEDGSPLSAI